MSALIWRSMIFWNRLSVIMACLPGNPGIAIPGLGVINTLFSRIRLTVQPSNHGSGRTPFMPWIVGIDEAGYGPNLGPLVMTSVACRVPDGLADADLWSPLQSAVRRHSEVD